MLCLVRYPFVPAALRFVLAKLSLAVARAALDGKWEIPFWLMIKYLAKRKPNAWLG